MIGYSPIIPLSGYTGWRFLEKTMDRQQAAFDSSAQIKREIDYFSNKIGDTLTAKDLVADRRLLRVALGAFGLEDDIDKKAYVLKALEEGTDSRKAFANRMVDKRYQEFVKAFGYGNQSGPAVNTYGFVADITRKYKIQKFEQSVGEVDQSMRLAMTFSREIGGFANSNKPDSTAWYKILGNPPMRSVFETAFGLPGSFGRLDIDRQMQIMREKAGKMLGDTSVAVFKDPEKVTKLLQTFFLRKQMSEGAGVASSQSIALSLLGDASTGMSGLVQSRLF